ncbi:Uma2 family endonuclease [Streptomyces tendae]|uniref:Uma2 family endonuclease n=1 Tax=Streptomyces tendae TaxID=1932 RepID=UPI0034009210
MREEPQLEFLGGRLARKLCPDGSRGRVIQRLTRACLSQRPGLWLDSRQGLSVGRHREGRARPDGSLVPSHAFAGADEWADPGPGACAGAGIPVHLLIDRDTCEVKVHSRPDGGRYETVQTCPSARRSRCPSR